MRDKRSERVEPRWSKDKNIWSDWEKWNSAGRHSRLKKKVQSAGGHTSATLLSIVCLLVSNSLRVYNVGICHLPSLSVIDSTFRDEIFPLCR